MNSHGAGMSLGRAANVAQITAPPSPTQWQWLELRWCSPYWGAIGRLVDQLASIL
jgi:hypothetical protein